MLPVETQEHLYDQIPREHTIEWRRPEVGGYEPVSATLDITVRQNRQRKPPRDDYPLVVAYFDPIAVSWSPGQRLPDTHHKEPVPNDHTVAYREHVGEDMYDQLNIIVAVADGVDTTGNHRTDIPQRVVARKLTQEVYASFLFGTDHLNSETYMSRDYEWPVKVEETSGEGIVPLTDPLRDDQDISQYAMQFRCRYTMTEERVVPAVQAVKYTADVANAGNDDLPDEASGTVDLVWGYGRGGYGIGEYGE